MHDRGELQDLNLSGIEFSNDGASATLHLVDMLPPYKNSRFECHNVYSFIFHRTADEKVPFYLGELTWGELDEAEKRAALERMRYPLFDQDGEIFVMKGKVISVHLEGGLCADILAENVVLVDAQALVQTNEASAG